MVSENFTPRRAAMHVAALVLLIPSVDASRLITALKQPIMAMRWQTELLAAGRAPLRLGVDVEVRENDKGRGLYAMRTLAAEAIVERYSGPVVPYDTFLASDSSGQWAMALSNGDVVDAEDENKGSFVRFINHSVRKANCRQCDCGGSFPFAWIETLREIQPGEELLFNYVKIELIVS